MNKQVFDKKEKSILELDKLLKDVGKNARIANELARKENDDHLKMQKTLRELLILKKNKS